MQFVFFCLFCIVLSSVIEIWWRHKPAICRLETSSLLLACPFLSLNIKIYVKNWKSPVAYIRKMLLMKDRSFLYELRACLIYVKMGERSVLYGLRAYLIYEKVEEKVSYMSWEPILYIKRWEKICSLYNRIDLQPQNQMRKYPTTSGPGCSKLTTSLVNVSLKFQMLISEICQYFCWKNVRSFCTAKASLFFTTKNISVFGNKVLKHLTSWPLNELVKLTMLWTTGPRWMDGWLAILHCKKNP